MLVATLLLCQRKKQNVLNLYCSNINTVLKTKSQRKEVLAALVELFNPFRTLNTHMHSKASLMVNKHHSEPSLVFLPGHRKAFALRALETKQSMPTRVNKFEKFYQVIQHLSKTFKPTKAVTYDERPKREMPDLKQSFCRLRKRLL